MEDSGRLGIGRTPQQGPSNLPAGPHTAAGCSTAATSVPSQMLPLGEGCGEAGFAPRAPLTSCPAKTFSPFAPAVSSDAGVEDRRALDGADLAAETQEGRVEALPPSKVAARFMEMFYHVMNDYTPQLHQFYRHESCLMVQEVADEGESWSVSANGQEDIHHILDTLYNDVTVKVEAHSSQRSIDGSVLLLVTGRMRRQVSKEERLFNQAFLLARQPNGFYVHTDNIIVHGATASSLFFARWTKGGTKREEEPEPVAIDQEQAEDADALGPAPEEQLPEGRENDGMKPSYMEALLKTSTEREALKQLQRGQSGRSQASDESRGAAQRTAVKVDMAVQKDEQGSEHARKRGEAGAKRPKAEAGKREKAKTIAAGARPKRGVASRSAGSGYRRVGAREAQRWQGKGGGGVDTRGVAPEDGGRRLAQAREEGRPNDGPDQRTQAQTKGRPRTAKMIGAEKRELADRRIFVAKLPLGVKRESVEEAFKAFGDIETVAVRAGEKTAFAFITYETKGAACDALAQVDVVVEGKTAIAKKWIDNQQRENGRYGERQL